MKTCCPLLAHRLCGPQPPRLLPPPPPLTPPITTPETSSSTSARSCTPSSSTIADRGLNSSTSIKRSPQQPAKRMALADPACSSTSSSSSQDVHMHGQTPPETDRKHARDVADANCTPDSYSILEADPSDAACPDRPRILSVLSSLLEQIVEANEKQQESMKRSGGLSPSHHHHHHSNNGGSQVTVFHGQRAPSISIDKYLERIYKYANCSPACFVVAYAYIERAVCRRPGLPITSLNVHRLLVTSVMAAAKFLDDAYFNNAYYAKVGGVTTSEMNRLELEFLFRLDFRLNVTVPEFESYCRRLDKGLLMANCMAVDRPIRQEREDPRFALGHKKRIAVACPVSVMIAYNMQKKANDVV